MEMIQAELIGFLVALIAGCVGWVTKSLLAFLRSKGIVAKLESEKEIVHIAVSAIEQLYSGVNGNDKLRLARQEIAKLANKRGIKITETDIDVLIEATVREIKKEIKK